MGVGSTERDWMDQEAQGRLLRDSATVLHHTKSASGFQSDGRAQVSGRRSNQWMSDARRAIVRQKLASQRHRMQCATGANEKIADRFDAWGPHQDGKTARRIRRRVWCQESRSSKPTEFPTTMPSRWTGPTLISEAYRVLR